MCLWRKCPSRITADAEYCVAIEISCRTPGEPIPEGGQNAQGGCAQALDAGAGPSCPAGPYRFVNREYLVITYETYPALIRAQLPEPLEPAEQPFVHYEWIKMPDSSGFGSMGYKHESMAGNGAATTATLSKTQVNLKLIPSITGKPEICQLVGLNLTEITVRGSWMGPGRLHLMAHVNAPVADLPVRRVAAAHHFIADLTLPFGRVLFDYMKDGAAG